MTVLVFVTDDGRAPDESGEMLVISYPPAPVLPPHPRSLAWRYFATMDESDQMFFTTRQQLHAALESGLPFVTPRMMK